MSKEPLDQATPRTFKKRSTADRRQTNRRDPARQSDDKGILTTRRAVRRRSERRQAQLADGQ